MPSLGSPLLAQACHSLPEEQKLRPDGEAAGRWSRGAGPRASEGNHEAAAGEQLVRPDERRSYGECVKVQEVPFGNVEGSEAVEEGGIFGIMGAMLGSCSCSVGEEAAT